jgi:hypothetical protein
MFGTASLSLKNFQAILLLWIESIIREEEVGNMTVKVWENIVTNRINFNGNFAEDLQILKDLGWKYTEEGEYFKNCLFKDEKIKFKIAEKNYKIDARLIIYYLDDPDGDTWAGEYTGFLPHVIRLESSKSKAHPHIQWQTGECCFGGFKRLFSNSSVSPLYKAECLYTYLENVDTREPFPSSMRRLVKLCRTCEMPLNDFRWTYCEDCKEYYETKNGETVRKKHRNT